MSDDEKKDISPQRMLQATIDVAKAMFIGEEDGTESQALKDLTAHTNKFTNSGAIRPIYDPAILALIYENSSSLRQNVDAYVTNIDSFGHHFKPVIDVDDTDSDEVIRDAIRAERRYEAKRNPVTGTDGKAVVVEDTEEPTDAEVKKRKDELRVQIRAERADLEVFFENCSPLVPFSGPEGLRGLTRQDIEVFGYGYWEVLRNAIGEVAVFSRLEARSMRLMPVDDKATDVQITKHVSKLTDVSVDGKKRFRRFMQIYEGSDVCVYFKEFGDPRVISSKTGNAYASIEIMQLADKEGPEVAPATEVIEFKISSVRTQYGVPRWVGAMLAVLGTRQSEEVNFLYFENRSVPPMAIIVTGGRLNKDTTSRLEDHIANQIRGKRNFHKTLIIEGEPFAASSTDNTGPNNGRMKVELKPLTDAQQKDGLFQNYDERNADKVGQMFRLPRLLRGDVRDFNRSTAEASVDFAEVQVFGPIREQFDWAVNALIMPACGFHLHKFHSNAPTIRDPEQLADNITKLVTASVLTPEEARALCRGVFNEDLKRIKAPWTQMPIALSLAGRKVEDDLNTPGVNEADEFAGQDDFNAAGGMSAPGAGASQAALQVPQNKDGDGGGDMSTGDLASGGALQPAQGNRYRRRRLTTKARALIKLRNELDSEAREEWKREKADAEVLVIPADLFKAAFESTE